MINIDSGSRQEIMVRFCVYLYAFHPIFSFLAGVGGGNNKVSQEETRLFLMKPVCFAADNTLGLFPLTASISLFFIILQETFNSDYHYFPYALCSEL